MMDIIQKLFAGSDIIGFVRACVWNDRSMLIKDSNSANDFVWQYLDKAAALDFILIICVHFMSLETDVAFSRM